MKKMLTLTFLLLIFAFPAQAEVSCRPLEERPVKIEAWMAKKKLPQFREMRREYGRMGSTYVSIFTYPGNNPSRVVAIGRCVPAYIARHALETTLHYYGSISHLVNQGFVAPHWMGLATSLFSENSQRPITRQQLNRLLDPSLGTQEFHALYQNMTVQEQMVEGFGMRVPNPKLLK
ncbi:MAG: hypothetical protein G3M70_05650 [Candidatus Nitronauta litoralis]|uniref:Uncharacterized protein n=1 Tax=Candidatus Nitronauta litoralis TaxID=2705533 RepID=A0A7T0G002_9BACT|nr:MAG: hypothetical protein G3M70_05650 [Candidatus Nitronauta litoralis]